MDIWDGKVFLLCFLCTTHSTPLAGQGVSRGSQLIIIMTKAVCFAGSDPMDLMETHTQCPTCLGIEHLREALLMCKSMAIEVRQQQLSRF